MPDTNPTPQQRWTLIAELFAGALELPAEARAAFVRAGAPGDAAAQQEVLAMLDAHHSGEPLLLEEERRFRPSDPALRAGDLPPGTRIGPWRVERLVGQGGMGEVYRAERVDGAYRQAVAIKVLRPGYHTAETVRRFRVERQALARLVHPGIAAIIDGGALEDGRPYLVLQHVDGVPITRYCTERGLDLAARLRLLVRVARVVEFAHGQLVIHRDLKPSNIFIEADGTPRLLDFGISRMLDPGLDASLVRPTRPEGRLLTPEHAAPEQLRGEPCDTRTDVYGLGVLLFQLLTDRTPFPAARRTLLDLERAILDAPAPLPSAVVDGPARRRALRGDLDVITQAALRKEPDRRYPSAAALADDIERYLAGLPVRAQPDRLGYRARKYLRRNGVLVGSGALLALLLLGFALTAATQARRLRVERDAAERERAVSADVVQILAALFERANPRKVPGGDTVRVSALLDEAEQRIERMVDDTARQAALLRAVGQMHLARGQYKRAERLLRRSAELQWVVRGPEDLEAARTYHELATVVHFYRGSTASQPMFDSSLARFRRLQGPDGPDVQVALTDLATATAAPGPRRALLDELVAIQARQPGVDSMAVAGRLHAQAEDFLGQGRAREAAGLFQATLDILAARLPPDHPDRQTVTNNLSVALGNAGDLAAAESLQRAGLARVLVQQPSADVRAGAQERLALTLAHRGQLEEAEQLERAAIAGLRAGLAADNPLIGSSLRNLALILAARGRLVEGLAYLDSAIVQGQAAGAARDPLGAAYLIGQRSPILLRLGRLNEAVAAARFGDSVIQSNRDTPVRRRADADRWMALVSYALGAHDTVILRATAHLEAQPPNGGVLRPESAQVECVLGAALAARGRREEARRALEHACPVHDAWGLANPMVTGWGREALARLR